MMMSNETVGRELAKAMGFKSSKTDEMFDRAEALQNTAKAIKGLKALDDDALETLYLEAKAERRERNKVPVIQPGLRAFAVDGKVNAETIKDMKDLAFELSERLPDATIERMKVLESGSIEVTYTYENDEEEYVATFKQN